MDLRDNGSIAGLTVFADVARVMDSLSDLGRRVAPSDAARVAHYIPPHATDIEEFYTPIHPADVWGDVGGLPDDVLEAIKPLLKLQSTQALTDPRMLGLYESIFRRVTSACARHRPTARGVHGDHPCTCEPAVDYLRLMMGCETSSSGADRTLRFPSYDTNKGVEESDIAAYPLGLTVDHRWGKGHARTAEDCAGAAGVGSDASSHEPVSVHASGGLTWMQRALSEKSSIERTSDFLQYREGLLQALGAEKAAGARANAVSHGFHTAEPYATASYFDQVITAAQSTPSVGGA